MIYIIGTREVFELFLLHPDEATQMYRVVYTIHNSIGGGNEIVGALWTLLISVVGFRHGYFNKKINVIGCIVGVAGILTMVVHCLILLR